MKTATAFPSSSRSVETLEALGSCMVLTKRPAGKWGASYRCYRHPWIRRLPHSTENFNEIVVRQALFLFNDIGSEVEEPDKTAVYRRVEPFRIEADSINLVQGKEIVVESFHGDGRLSMHEDETHDDVPERSGLSFREEWPFPRLHLIDNSLMLPIRRTKRIGDDELWGEQVKSHATPPTAHRVHAGKDVMIGYRWSSLPVVRHRASRSTCWHKSRPRDTEIPQGLKRIQYKTYPVFELVTRPPAILLL